MPPTQPSSHDVVQAAWGPVTVRVAWVLATHGIAVKPEVLRDARDHVWFSLPADATVAAAEDRAERLVAAYVTRARRKVWSEPFPEDRDHPLPASWRDRLFRGLSRAASVVLRLHLADGHPLDALAQRTQVDLLSLEAAREGLREVLRRTAAKDGEDLDAWSDARLDHLLHRLVVRSVDGAPPLVEVVDGLHPDHAERCVTASRARALVRQGTLRREDLEPPRAGALASDRVRVLALHVHPDGRRALPDLIARSGGRAFPLAEDLVLLDASDVAARREQLGQAAEEGQPPREHLRGVVAEGPGRWTRHGLVGPLVDQLPAAALRQPWGHIDGLGELPEPTPPAPSARRAWTAVTALSIVCALALNVALQPPPAPVDHPLDLAVVPAEDGLWLDLAVAEEAHLVVVADDGRGLTVLLDGSQAHDKAAVAVGDGSYRLRAAGRGVLVASSSDAIPELPGLVHAAGAGEAALERLGEALRGASDGVDVAVARR